VDLIGMRSRLEKLDAGSRKVKDVFTGLQGVAGGVVAVISGVKQLIDVFAPAQDDEAGDASD
jgi:hypothetical protein